METFWKHLVHFYKDLAPSTHWFIWLLPVLCCIFFLFLPRCLPFHSLIKKADINYYKVPTLCEQLLYMNNYPMQYMSVFMIAQDLAPWLMQTGKPWGFKVTDDAKGRGRTPLWAVMGAPLLSEGASRNRVDYPNIMLCLSSSWFSMCSFFHMWLDHCQPPLDTKPRW